MSKHWHSVFTTLVLALAVVTNAFAAPAPSKGGPGDTTQDLAAGSYIVVFKDDVSDPLGATGDFSNAYGLTAEHTYSYALKGFAAKFTADQLKAVQSDPRVLFVSEDRPVHAIGGVIGAPAAPTAQTLPTGINRIDAENKTNTGAGVNVAVIDTGIDTTHPDLAANIVGGKNCSTGISYKDGNGHGTHVAGTIAGVNNTVGVVGVAPGAKLWAVRVLNNAGSGTWGAIICGIDFVTANAPANGGPITVANMSLGGTGSDDNNCGNSNNDAMHKAICRSVAAGVTYVVAAGNETDNAANHVPAAYDEVITVSALSDSNGLPGGGGPAPTCRSGEGDDRFATFSNYGADVDIAAPGVCIYSTWKGGAYNTISGTSMASPHVAGVAALYVKTHPGATPAQVRSALIAAWEAGPITGDPDSTKEGIVDASSF